MVVPPDSDPPVELLARRVVVTRLSPRNIQGVSLRVPRVRWAPEVTVYGKPRLVTSESGAGSAIAGGFTVETVSGAEYRKRAGKAGRRELVNASRRRKRVGLYRKR